MKEKSIHKIVDKDVIIQRRQIHGSNFQTLTLLWNNFFKKRFGIQLELTPQDTSIMMALHKISRLIANPGNYDSFTDMINYFWIGLNYDEYSGNQFDGVDYVHSKQNNTKNK